MTAPLDGLIFDAVYGSWILSLLLFTLVIKGYIVMHTNQFQFKLAVFFNALAMKHFNNTTKLFIKQLLRSDKTEPFHYKDGCGIRSARNNSRPLAIFQPISAFGRPKSILVSQISCTFSMRTAISNLINILFSKNGRPIANPYFQHCIHVSMHLKEQLAWVIDIQLRVIII